MKLPRPALPLVLLTLAVVGCGDAGRSAEVGDVPAQGRSTAATAPEATAPGSTPTPAPTGPSGPTASPEPQGTIPGATAAPDPGGASVGEAQPGGAGDEEAIRQPVRFTLTGDDVQPGSVAVAPFLAVALTVVNADQAAHAVRLIGTGEAFDVPAGASVDRRLAGLKAGVYTLSVDGGKAVASLVVGDDAGP